ncbi:hypothetical protein PG994_005999, partial [Apiospora phragmitis]
QPPFEPQQDELLGANHQPTNLSTGLPFNPFADGRLPNTCLGCIPEVRTRIRTAFVSTANSGHILSFAVTPIMSYYGLEHYDTIFALISKTNCAVINQIYGYHNVQLRAFVHHSIFKHAISSHSAKHPATLKVDINVYGVRDEAYSVGKVLSSGGLMLQQPSHGLEGITYYNPHFLHIRECEAGGGGHVEKTPLYDLRLTQGTYSEEQIFRKSAEDIAGGDIEIETMFNNLTHIQQLQRRAADRGKSKICSADIIKVIKRRQSTLSYAGSPSILYRSSIFGMNTKQILETLSHDIRNRNTRQFEVAASLAAQRRWCLTGTPIQNSLDDLGALVAFLRIPLLENALTFQRFIVNQSKRGARYRFKNLRTLLESVCMRRTKEIIGLADPIQETRKLTFTAAERDQYNGLLRKYEVLIDMGVSGHSTKGGSTVKVQSFLKLRLFCNNGMPPTGMSSDGLDPDETLTYLQQIDEAVCVYCDSTIFTINDTPGTDGGHMLSGCSHLACCDCYVHRYSREANCPQCTQNKDHPILETTPFEGTRPREVGETPLRPSIPTQRYPTKLLAFVGDIEKQQIHKRLNLAAASRIYLLEPQWNPSVEQQAFGRALRLGQTDQVTIIRYIMKDTVEDSNVQNRQLNKLQLAVGGFRKRKRAPDG